MAIAVVGIGCRFPGHANSPREFWRLLCDGGDAITEIPKDRFDIDRVYHPDPSRPGKLHIRRAGFSDHADLFDAAFFHISPREAAQMDPQQRMLLEVAWEAFEDGGKTLDEIAGSRCGVFIGISTHDYADVISGPLNRDAIDAHTATGTATSIAANRISYAFDLVGPSIALDTACSSSLTAVHLACRSLIDGECDAALAGGVNLFLTPDSAMGLAKASMLSPDGVCRAFDARANGFVRGEGTGIVVLRRLDSALRDRDRIYALILGSAINQDGRTTGMTVPSADRQKALFQAVLSASDLQPGAVGYVEAHGTGTVVGDPIEAEAIGHVYSADRRTDSPLAIGSVKTNIGHLEAAAGIAGLIKAALVLRHRQIPPHLNFVEPNPAIKFDELRLRVPLRLEPWPRSAEPAIVAVNSFGFGGANAHLVMQEAPVSDEPNAPRVDGERARVLILSAKTPESLRLRAHDLSQFLDDEKHDLDEACYTAAVHRTRFEHRLAVVGMSREDVLKGLRSITAGEPDASVVSGRGPAGKSPRLVFIFTGMGPDLNNRSRILFEHEPVFRDVLQRCDEILEPLAGWSMIAALRDPSVAGRVGEAAFAQVANYGLQAGLVALLRSWGVAPAVVMGHSVGEIAAAYAAGLLTLEDGLRLVFHRGRLVERASGKGRMLSVALSWDEAHRLLEPYANRVSVAAINGPRSITLSGEANAIEQIASALSDQHVFCRFLKVTVPYHSPALDDVREEFLESISDIATRDPVLPLVSTTLGRHITRRVDVEHWWRNLRDPVRFSNAMSVVAGDGPALFLQVGPEPVLRANIRECLAERADATQVLATLIRGEVETLSMLRSVAALHVNGVRVDWKVVLGAGSRCGSLPTYPWQHERFGTGREIADRNAARIGGLDSSHPMLGVRLPTARPSWQAELSDYRLEFLTDHRVQGAPVFPAAAYIEMALAARTRLPSVRRVSIEELTFDKMLVLSEGRDPEIQFTFNDDERFEIHSRTGHEDERWSLQAHGVVRGETAVEGNGRDGVAPASRVDLDGIRDRCGNCRDAEDLYALLRRRGLDYRGAFRSVQRIWQGHREALGRIALADSARSSQTYSAHPALVEGALQVLIAAEATGASSGPDETFLPASIERIDWYGPPGADAWVHARIHESSRSAITGAVTICDDDGRPVLDIQGIRAVRVGAPANAERTELLLHELRWQDSPMNDRHRPALPAPAAVLYGLSRQPRPSADETHAAYSPAVRQKLNALAAARIRRGLSHIGYEDLERKSTDPYGLAESFGVIERHRRLFARLAQISHAASETTVGDIDAFQRQIVRDHGHWAHIVDLIGRVGDSLPDLLRGAREPQEVLFSTDALPILTRAYEDIYTNRILADSVAIAVRAAEHASRFRVLEIGAGTGAATSAVLSHLPAGSFEYCFTDLSPFFLASAKARFADRTDMTFAVLDIERDVRDSLPFDQFDLVVAANVIHGTADVRAALRNVKRLVAPDGLAIVLELVAAEPWTDLIFGPFQGWWKFSDIDLRPAHAVLNREGWLAAFGEAGFDAVAPSHYDGDPDFMHRVFIARPESAQTAQATAPAKWMIVRDNRGIAARLAATLHARGASCALLDINEVAAAAGSEHFAGIVHLTGIDLPALDSLPPGEPLESVLRLMTGVTDLVRLFRPGENELDQLWLITAAAQSVEGDPEWRGLQQPLWAVGRVIMEELPGVRCRLADLSAAPTDNELEALAAEMSSDRPEDELAFRGTRRFVARIARMAPTDLTASEEERPVQIGRAEVRLEVDEPGNLDSLAVRAARLEPPASDEILIRVHAAGLNFRDVMHALGLIPFARDPRADTRQPLGFECSGVVVAVGDAVRDFRPGDEVCAIATGAMSSYVRALARFAFRRPDALSMEDAGGVLLPFMTAEFGLRHLARIEPGERVLIHSAAGGVGLAAIQVCRNAGAEIFATAGTAEKRALLQSMGISHIMDSRSLDFADRILETTRGEGVDVVLNSLAGPAIAKGLSILRPFGRFIEIGKRDFIQNSRLELAPFQRHLSFFAVDLDRVRRDRPDRCAALARDVLGKFASGEFQAPPRIDFDLSDARSAFRLMAQGKHVGRIVVTMGKDSYNARPARAQFLFSPNATYLVTGGLGGFGLATAQWLVEQGARHLVLVGRRAVPLDRNRAALDALLATGASVTILAADVSAEDEVARVLQHIGGSLPPLRGVFHAAMVLDDQRISDLTPEQWKEVLAPKISGAWNLHRLTANLDYFVVFSSATVVLGNIGQASYAAGNAFLDALVLHRRAVGLPGTSVAWGLLGDVGIVVDRPDLQRYFDRIGFEPIVASEAFEQLERMLRSGAAYAMPFRMNWSRLASHTGRIRQRCADMLTLSNAASRPAGPTALMDATDVFAAADPRQAIEAHLARKAATVLATLPERIDVDTALTNLGLDSLMAVELESAIKKDLGLQVGAVRLLQGISIRQLASAILEQRRPVTAEQSPTPRAVRPTRLPLAPGQRRLWYLQQLNPSSAAYNMALSVTIAGPLNAAALEAALNEVVRRQDALRVTFSLEDGEPLQSIAPEYRLSMPVTDISTESDRDHALERLALDASRQMFDLSEGPLISSRLVRVSDRRHVLLATAHHLVVDAWSAGIITRQAVEYYRAFTAGRIPGAESPSTAYADTVLRQIDVQAERQRVQLAYWTNQLSDVPPLRLPFDRRPAPEQTCQSARLELELPQRLQESLEALARLEGTTLFTILLSAFNALLAGYSGQDDFCVGTPVANRFDDETRDMVGCFVNTLAIRARITASTTFRELVGQTRNTVLAASENQDVTWERVVEHLNPPREPGRLPVFQTLFVLHNFPMASATLPGLTIESRLVHTGATPFDLILFVDAHARRVAIEYSVAFEADTIHGMIRSFFKLLEDVVKDPDQLAIGLPAARDQEPRRVSRPDGGPRRDRAQDRCLHQLFEMQANRTPDALAVKSAEERLTYRELNEAAEALAGVLRAHGAGPGSHVAVACVPSSRAVTATLAVLKAGAAFVPVDVRLPAERMQFIVDDVRPLVVLTDQSSIHSFVSACPVIAIDDTYRIGVSPVRITTAAATPRDLAYVLYTSGSTGRPKGVMVEHVSICHQIAWRQSAFPLAPDDAVLFSTSQTFDPSIWEIFGPLSAGAAIAIAPGDARVGAVFNRALREGGVTDVQVVPSVLRMLLEQNAFEDASSLRRVFCGGEQLDATLREQFFRQVNADLVNLYGCTETAIDAAFHCCQRASDRLVAPIGQPISNTRLYLLNALRQPVPDGMPGDLYVAGPGLARGYLNDPDLTTARFVPDPLVAGEGSRAFRTGDVARRLPGGDLEFIGRSDRQLKIRGVRIEPAEIESVLRRHPSVREARVDLRTHASRGPFLVAWIVPRADDPISHTELNAFLSRWLPDIMLPAQYLRVVDIPLLPSGKTDLLKLSGPEPLSAPRIKPRTELEAALVRLWADVLGTNEIGVTDSFFDLGGHSLLALRLAARMTNLLGVDVSCRDVLGNPTIERQAAFWRALQPPGPCADSQFVSVPSAAIRSPDALR